MSEEEVICWVEDEIIQTKRLLRQTEVGFIREDEEERINALETILDLYKKEKEKNKKLQEIIIINEKLYNEETKRLGNIISELLEE